MSNYEGSEILKDGDDGCTIGTEMERIREYSKRLEYLVNETCCKIATLNQDEELSARILLNVLNGTTVIHYVVGNLKEGLSNPKFEGTSNFLGDTTLKEIADKAKLLIEVESLRYQGMLSDEEILLGASHQFLHSIQRSIDSLVEIYNRPGAVTREYYSAGAMNKVNNIHDEILNIFMKEMMENVKRR